MILNNYLTEVVPLQSTASTVIQDIFAPLILALLLIGVTQAYFTAEEIADIALALPPTAIVTQVMNDRLGRPTTRINGIFIGTFLAFLIAAVYIATLKNITELNTFLSIAAFTWAVATAVGGLLSAQHPFRTRVNDILDSDAPSDIKFLPLDAYTFDGPYDKAIASLQFGLAVILPILSWTLLGGEFGGVGIVCSFFLLIGFPNFKWFNSDEPPTESG